MSRPVNEFSIKQEIVTLFFGSFDIMWSILDFAFQLSKYKFLIFLLQIF